MALAFTQIKEIYQKTNKKSDFLFNQWVCRPLAAGLVYLLKDTKITPNQVTFLSLATALLGSTTFLLWHAHIGLIIGAILLLLAFVLDCTDGQLARIRGTSSQVGGLLDFLMDEIKAVVLVAAIAGHLAFAQIGAGNVEKALFWLGIGLGGVVVVSSGISLTTFIRRPEYTALFPQGLSSSSSSQTEINSLIQQNNPSIKNQENDENQISISTQQLSDITTILLVQAKQKDSELPQNSQKSQTQLSSTKALLQKAIKGFEWIGRLVINYPAWLWLPAFLGKIEWFLIPYLVAHFLYLGRAGLGVVWKLGRR